MKKNLKFLVMVLAFVLMVMSCSSICTLKHFAYAQSTDDAIKLGSFLCSEYITDDEKLTRATPRNGNIKMPGESWIVAQKGNTSAELVGQTHADDQIDFSTAIDGFDDIAKVDNLYVDMWMFFAGHGQLDLTITLSSDSSSVVWNLSAEDLQELLAKDYSTGSATNYDLAFFTEDTIPYGWNLLRLPFETATKTGQFTVEEELLTKLNLNTLKIEQSEGLYKSELYVYNVEFGTTENTLTANSVIEKQDYVYISKKTSTDKFVQGNFYIGEVFRLPSFSEVFNAVYLGDKDLLSDEFRNEQYFKIIVKDGATKTDYFYQTDSGLNASFKIEKSYYTITFCVGNAGNFASIGTANLNAENYGTGVWFTNSSTTLKVGEELNLNYNVHKAFADSTIQFISSDESVLQIVSQDKINQKVVVKALKKGEAKVIIKVYDDRLNTNGTSYEDGLVNDDLTISVENSQKKASLVKILLWISFACIVAYSIYAIIKVVKNANKFQVR